jgi:hypothetical protein
MCRSVLVAWHACWLMVMLCLTETAVHGTARTWVLQMLCQKHMLLLCCCCRVVWTSGRSVRKRFTASSDVLQVCLVAAGHRADQAPHLYSICLIVSIKQSCL